MQISKKHIFYGLIILVLLILSNIFFINKISNLSNKFDNYENVISALNDSIKVSVKNGITEYSKKSVEINLDEFIKSETFKSLTLDQQKYYTELSKIKGLISSTNAELQKIGVAVGTILEGNNPGTIDNDSISFKLGTPLNFAEQDTTKKLQWNASVILDKNINFKMDYDYKFNIQTTYERKKDKSVVVSYKIDDPELKVNKMLNYNIPADQKRTKFGRWVERNKYSIGGSILGTTFIGGAYAGYKLSK